MEILSPGAESLLLSLRHCDIGPAASPLLSDISWDFLPGEAWVITGPNGGGKSAFAAGLTGRLPLRARHGGRILTAFAGTSILVSFEEAAALIERERSEDDSDFVEGGFDPGRTVRRLLLEARGHTVASVPEEDRARLAAGLDAHPAVLACGIHGILDRSLKVLSTGEVRRSLLARALYAQPALLVLDEPYEGLDSAARVVLEDILERLARDTVKVAKAGGREDVTTHSPESPEAATPEANPAIPAQPPALVLLTDRWERIPKAINRVLEIAGRAFAFQGSRAEYESLLKSRGDSAAARGRSTHADHGNQTPSDSTEQDRVLALLAQAEAEAIVLAEGRAAGKELEVARKSIPFQKIVYGDATDAGPPSMETGGSPGASGLAPTGRGQPVPLVELRDVTVGWSGHTVLDRLSWIVRPGEHWLVRGPNGSGKTTLLELVTGDNPQAFSNDVRIFGIRRGSGETVWELKVRMGIVSYRLHLEYRYLDDASLEEVLVSGLHDSIGLYVEPGDAQRTLAGRWLGLAGFGGRGRERFGRLSFGEQRTILVARAAIKIPELLVLDEPCHGLDPAHRSRVLGLLEAIAQAGRTTLLHVTHDPDEVLSCERRILQLGTGKDRGWEILER